MKIYVLHSGIIEYKEATIVDWVASKVDGFFEFSKFTPEEYSETKEWAIELWNKWRDSKISKMEKAIEKLRKKKCIIKE